MKHSPLSRGFLSLRKRKMHHLRQHGRFFKHHFSEEDRYFSSEEDHNKPNQEQDRIDHDSHMKHKLGYHHGMKHHLGHHGMKHHLGHHGMKHHLGHHGMKHHLGHHGMKHHLGHHGMKPHLGHHGMKHHLGHHGMEHHLEHHGMEHHLEHNHGMKHELRHHHGMKHNQKHGHGKRHMIRRDHGFAFHHGFTDDHHGHGMKHGMMHKRSHGSDKPHKLGFHNSDHEESSAYNSCSEIEEVSTSESKTKAKVTKENGKFQISLDTSYYQPEKVTVEIMDGKINVSAIHESMDDDLYEFHEMYRSFSIPAEVNPIIITSQLNADGKLTVEAPISAPEESAINEREIPVVQASE